MIEGEHSLLDFTTTLRALTFHAPEDVHHETVPDPVLREPGDAIVRVERTAICGSDLHVYHGREVGLDAGTTLGHEFLGEVVEVGPAVERFRPGDRAVSAFSTSCGTCFYCERGLTSRCEKGGEVFGWVERGAGVEGAQSELVRVPLADGTLVRCPEDTPLDEALLAGDVLSTGFFCADAAGIRPGDVVVVLGCGPVGLCAVLGAREAEAGRVLAVDRVPERLALAADYGAETIDFGAIDPVVPVREATAGRGADVVLEVVGSPQATRLGVDLLRPGGTLSAAGVHTEATFAFTPGEAYDKNLTYRAGRCPARAYAERMLTAIRDRRFDLSAMISHKIPLAEGVHGYRIFADKLDGCTKVLLEP